jgi:hypothetical protein
MSVLVAAGIVTADKYITFSDVARTITGQASDLHLQSHKIVPYTEASRIQSLMEASQTAPFKVEEYYNLAFKQPHVSSQAILFGQPLPTTVPKNHLHSDLPPVYQFFLRDPIVFPSRALRRWPVSVCLFRRLHFTSLLFASDQRYSK